MIEFYKHLYAEAGGFAVRTPYDYQNICQKWENQPNVSGCPANFRCYLFSISKFTLSNGNRKIWNFVNADCCLLGLMLAHLKIMKYLQSCILDSSTLNAQVENTPLGAILTTWEGF